jgi:hypothetical protein
MRITMKNKNIIQFKTENEIGRGENEMENDVNVMHGANT